MSYPQELIQLRSWILWKGNKIPYSPVTLQSQGWQKPESWVTGKEAREICKANGFTNVGFVVQPPYVVVDLDDCIEEDGMMNALAREITARFNTFTEYSLSGKGLHIYCKAREPIRTLRTKSVEVYGEGRYIIATGRALDENQLEVTDQTENLKELVQRYSVKPAAGEADKAEVFHEGERNNRMAAEIGRLYRFYQQPAVRAMAHELNRQQCIPPLPEAEVDSIVDSIGKRDVNHMPAPPMTQIDWEHVEGVRNLDQKPYTGIAKARGKHIPTGLPSIDFALNDLAPGRVTLITGRSNAGKSVLVKQITANAIGQGVKVLWVMGEGDQEMMVNALYVAAMGKDRRCYDYVKINKRQHAEPKAFALAALQRWHQGKLTLFDQCESKFKELGDLFDLIDREIRTNSHDLIVLDNLMSLLLAGAMDKYDAQADFMQRCHDLAIAHQKHIILVLHPNKEYRKGEEIEFEQISGTSDLYNKADNILAVMREYSSANIADGRSGKVAILKNRYYSDLPTIHTFFDESTGLLHEIATDGSICPYDFNWTQYIDPYEAPAEMLTIIQETIDVRTMRQMGEEE